MNDAPSAALSLPFWRVERILYDEDGLLVVDKPPGIPTYGGDERWDHGLVARLQRHFEKNGRTVELGVFQRLDQDTSGLLLFATNATHHAALAQAIEGHRLERSYRAVVELAPGRRLAEGRIERWLLHRKGRSEVFESAERAGNQARRAVTHVRILRRVGERALVECRLETGRTHQIRATLAHLGAPIVGDRVYGGALAFRLMLDAFRLAGPPLKGAIEREPSSALRDALEASTVPLSPSELTTRLLDASCLRAPLLDHTDALRLVNGEADGVSGLTVDLYGSFAVLNLYDADWLARLSEISAPLLDRGVAGIYLKKRVRSDLRKEVVGELAPDLPFAGRRAPDSFLVRENALRLHIDLHDGLSTGLFVDMRENRERLRLWLGSFSGQESQLRVLNLFSYTCSFSVAAALAGAHTTSVDLSGKALERGRVNFVANGLEPSEHRFFKEDAMKFLARAARRGDVYQFIVLDPPSFSTVKKGTFSVKNSYGAACADCLRLLAPGGKLLCVTNHTKTSPRAFVHLIREAARAASREIRSLKSLSAGLDCGDHSTGPWPSKSVLVEVE